MKPQQNSLTQQFILLCSQIKENPCIKLQRKQNKESNFKALTFLEQLNEKNYQQINEYRSDISKLTQLRLPGARDVSDAQYNTLSQIIGQITNLQEIHISQSNISLKQFTTFFKGLQDVKQINTIEIFTSNIDDNFCQIIAQFIESQSSLISLKLSDNNITSKGLTMIIQSIMKAVKIGQRMRTFHIGGNPIDATGINYLCQIFSNTFSLESMGLRNLNMCTEQQLTGLGGFLSSQNCQLQDLQLRKNNLSNNFEILTQALVFNNSLRVLELQDTHISAQHCQLLAIALKNNNSIHALNLSNNNLSDSAAHALAQIVFNCNQLTTFSLDSCNLTSQTVQIIMQSIFQPNSDFQNKKIMLAGISLSKNKITDSGLQALGQAVALGQITSLNLSNNTITGKGLQQFTQQINACLNSTQLCNIRLRHLDLSGNLLQQQGGEALGEFLSQNNSLLRLFITDCGISEEGGKQIAIALENNKTLIQMQYGGQTKQQNNISKQTKQQIDEQLKQNQSMHQVQSQQKLNVDSNNNLQQLIPSLPPQQPEEMPPGLGEYSIFNSRVVKSDDFLYPFNSQQSFGSNMFGDSQYNSFSNFDALQDQRRVNSMNNFNFSQFNGLQNNNSASNENLQIYQNQQKQSIPFLFEEEVNNSSQKQNHQQNVENNVQFQVKLGEKAKSKLKLKENKGE